MTATPATLTVTPELHRYLVEHGSPPDEIQRELIEETEALGGVARMQVGAEEGALLTLLARLVGARFAVEVGTFTGYSSICIARGLADGGRLLCCDVNEEWTAIARRYWDRAGIADRIELRLAPALDTLTALPAEPPVDLAFIDADKGGYAGYWDELAPRVRSGGLLVIDNTLWSGRVVDPDATDEDTQAIRDFNDRVAADDRFETVLLPIRDGVTIARKR